MASEKSTDSMALEYLLASYLLDCRVGDVLACVKRYRPGAGTLPRHVEEALILIKATRPRALAGTAFPIRDGTVKRFMAFNRILTQNGPRAAQGVLLRRGLGDTFWYYGRYVHPQIARLHFKTRRIHVDVL